MSNERVGSKVTPRFLTVGLCLIMQPAKFNVTSERGVSWGFGPIIIISVLFLLSCRRFCDIQVVTADRQHSRFVICE